MSGITPEELARCLALLERIVDDRSLLTTLDPAVRVQFLTAAGRVSRPTRDENRQVSKTFRRIKRQRLQAHDREATAATEIRVAREAEVFTPPVRLVGGAPAEAERPELQKPKNCYVCKALYTRLHFFYDSMCGSCAESNYEKRFQTASLEGKVALITGARVKIGFQAALMMLRAGARVIVTTRFPRDAARRFAREADFAVWRDRLDVHGLDLRHSPSVETFARYLVQSEARLDILVNNAAQTVRRPAGFYAHLLDLERRPFEELSADLRAVLRGHERIKAALGDEPRAQLTTGERSGFVAWPGDGPGMGIRASAMLSQVPCSYDDASRDAEMFPAGRSDANLQQVDLRTTNSWRLTLGEVPPPEMLEVQLVNAVAPFILCSKLKPLMLRPPKTPDQVRLKHIVNVSAMEGKFSRFTKTDKHPHTNMAKAALNMMTLTSAPDYAKDGIYMNAVDTGWVTDEDAAVLAANKRDNHDFQPPLDIVDGAARICDPFFSALLTGDNFSGKFLKDYTPTEW